MRVPRMTTRRWMIVVLAVAFAALVVELERRASVYHRRAYEHFVLAGGALRWKEIELRSSENRAYNMKMMRKWLAARQHPWIFVEPDPPPPEADP
jgi:hypothetical protein